MLRLATMLIKKMCYLHSMTILMDFRRKYGTYAGMRYSRNL